MRGAAVALLHGLTNAGTEVWWPGLIIAGIGIVLILGLLYIKYFGEEDKNEKEKTSTDIWIKNDGAYINKEEASLVTIQEPKVTQAVKKVKRAEEYINSNEFLKSFEWRRKRFEALDKYGRKCMCCGATPEAGAKIHVDHIKPRKLYPELALDINNLQILCHECNHGKGNKYETDFRSLEDGV